MSRSRIELQSSPQEWTVSEAIQSNIIILLKQLYDDVSSEYCLQHIKLAT